MQKIEEEKAIKMNSWQKIILFFKRNPLAILASVIVLYTWYHEKVTIEKHRGKVAESLRLDNSVNVLGIQQRVLQIQTLLTEMDRKNYGKDTVSYNTNYFTNVLNEVQIEIEYIHVLRASIDIDGDSVNQINDQIIQKKREVQTAFNTNNYAVIKQFHIKQTVDFSAEATKYNLLKQPTLNILNQRLEQQTNRYIVLYILSALLLFIDRISNVQPKLKSFIIK